MAGGDEAGEAEEARMGTGDHDGVESQVGYVEQVDPRSAQPKIERSRNRTRATTGLYCNVRAQLQIHSCTEVSQYPHLLCGTRLP